MNFGNHQVKTYLEAELILKGHIRLASRAVEIITDPIQKRAAHDYAQSMCLELEALHLLMAHHIPIGE